MINVLIIFGTRPEAIKMAPVVKTLQKNNNIFDVKVCVTAQHRDLLDQVLEIFQIKPDYDLNIMKSGQDLYDITSRVLLELRSVLIEAKPDVVLVHGDTTTSMAASLAAFYAQISVCHVEAGLRTHNIYSPWPEEINRQITGRIASFHLAPTELSRKNLLKENIDPTKIEVVGNTVIDALHMALSLLKENKSLQINNENLLLQSRIPVELLSKWKEHERVLVLITGHRRENFGKPFIQICESIKTLSLKYSNVDFVYPMHPNPHVKEAVESVFGEIESISMKYTNLFFCNPLEYLPFVSLMELSYLILTDSGGIQEEAPGLGKPVLVMRDTTERPEGVEAGTVKLVGTSKMKIVDEVSSLLENHQLYMAMSQAQNPYGDGYTSVRISEIIKRLFSSKLS